VEIYYDREDLEINGVFGSMENWREILLPLLGLKRRGKTYFAEAIKRRVAQKRPRQIPYRARGKTCSVAA